MAVICEAGDEELSSSKAGRVKRRAVAVGARVLFYPTLLYNVLRNNLEEEFRWWDQVDEFVLLGAVPFSRHVPGLKQAGVKGVVTLNEPFETLVSTDLYKKNGIEHCVIPTRDYFFAPAIEDIRRAVNFIRDHAERGEKTYVHCKAGRGRSTTVAICYLVEHKGMNPLEAFNHIRAIRPRVLLAASQWEAVWEYARQLHTPLLLEFPIGSDPENKVEKRCTCSSSGCEEPVVITEVDFADYEKQGQKWMLLKNLGLVISYIIRIKSYQVGCKPVQHDFSIQLTTAY